MTKDKFNFLLNAPRASLSLSDKMLQSALFQARGWGKGKFPDHICPSSVTTSTPKERAAKAQATRRANLAAAFAQFAEDEHASKDDSDVPDMADLSDALDAMHDASASE